MLYGNRIKDVRNLLKLKQKDFAIALGVSQSYLCSIESGKKQPNANLIMRLINEFKVNSLWLKDGVGPVFNGSENTLYIRAAEINEDFPEYNFPITKDYVEGTLNTMGEKLVYFTVESDNMEPTLKSGDIVLVDISLNNADQEGLYLFSINSKKIIRRLLFVPQKHLINDNPSIKENSIIFDNSIECLGKVIWFGRKI